MMTNYVATTQQRNNNKETVTPIFTTGIVSIFIIKSLLLLNLLVQSHVHNELTHTHTRLLQKNG